MKITTDQLCNERQPVARLLHFPAGSPNTVRTTFTLLFHRFQAASPWECFENCFCILWKIYLFGRPGGDWTLVPPGPFPGLDGVDVCRTLVTQHWHMTLYGNIWQVTPLRNLPYPPLKSFRWTFKPSTTSDKDLQQSVETFNHFVNKIHFSRSSWCKRSTKEIGTKIKIKWHRL